MQFIASICDGAVARDGLGFQKEHVAIGHALASADPAPWERWQQEWAMYFVRYYRRQLTEAGFDVDQILSGRPRRSTRSDAGAVERWVVDPYGLAEQRLWNGARWTATVREWSGRLEACGRSSRRSPCL